MPNFVPATLGQVGFIMDPIVAGMCSYESAKSGALDLADFALMNEALTVRAENEWRASEAAKRGAQ